MAQTIAITGANGFLGRHCTVKAVARGITVRGIVRRREAADLVEALGAVSTIVRRLNARELVEAFDGCDGVIHFVGIVSEQYGSLQEVNVGGTRLALDSAYASGVRRFVVPTGLGSDQYGKRSWATNRYFDSKRQIEEMCSSAPVPCMVFRPSYILGPGDELVPNLVNAILKGLVLIAGDGNTPMQPIYVEDAASAFIGAAIGLGSPRSIYDLVGPETITFMQLVSRVARVMREESYDVRDYEVENVPLKEAPEALRLSQEEVDVMLCDVLGDPKPLTRDFGVSLTFLDEAIRAAVKATKEDSI